MVYRFGCNPSCRNVWGIVFFTMFAEPRSNFKPMKYNRKKITRLLIRHKNEVSKERNELHWQISNGVQIKISRLIRKQPDPNEKAKKTSDRIEESLFKRFEIRIMCVDYLFKVSTILPNTYYLCDFYFEPLPGNEHPVYSFAKRSKKRADALRNEALIKEFNRALKKPFSLRFDDGRKLTCVSIV